MKSSRLVARGDAVGHHSDKFVAALLAELDGFASRGNVAIVAATNRKELLDPALYERLSDVEVNVPRPNRDGAKEIFLVHFAEHYPYSPNGAAARDTRARSSTARSRCSTTRTRATRSVWRALPTPRNARSRPGN